MVPVFPPFVHAVHIVAELRTEVNAQTLPNVNLEQDGEVQVVDAPSILGFVVPVAEALAGVLQLGCKPECFAEAFFREKPYMYARFVFQVGVCDVGGVQTDFYTISEIAYSRLGFCYANHQEGDRY